METRRCTYCRKEKPIDQFIPKRSLDKTRLTLTCEECRCKDRKRDQERRTDPEFREREKQRMMVRYMEILTCPEKRKAENKRKREYNHRIKGTPAGERTKELAAARLRKKRAGNPTVRLSASISFGIWKALREGKGRRDWEELVGYTRDDLVAHLTSLFEDGMTLENYGEWHIDHCKPLSWFNYETAEDEEFKECWALDNLKPMWADANRKKGNRYAD